MNYRMPAEWEPHEGTWLAWPHNKTHWPGKFEPIPDVYVNIIKSLSKSEKIFICVNDEKMEAFVKNLLGENSKNVFFFRIPTNASWSRDHGPIFVKDQNNQLTILDWNYNANGNKWGPCDLDDQVPVKISEKLNLPLVQPGIILEGGSIDCNGQGDFLTTRSCLLNKNRNPRLNKTQIEEYLKKYLGAKNILWLDEGIAGDDTDGHIDDLARFVDEKTIVCQLARNKKDKNYKILEKNHRDLKKMKSLNGKSFNVIPLPQPDPVIYDNMLLPASYANFYIGNTVVLVPIFRCPKDQIAIDIFKNIFPNKEIIGIDCADLVWGLGTIHCSTQQQPLS